MCMQTGAVSLSQDPAQLYFSWKKCNKTPSPRNNSLHVKTNTNICPRRFQKRNKGQDALDKKGLSFGLRKHHKVLKPRGLPLAAHRNSTGIHYTGERSIFSLGGSGNGKSMDFFGRGRNYQQSFSGFKVDATLEGGKLQISCRKIREKNHQGLYHLWRCPCDCRPIPAYLPRPLGAWDSHGPSDRATDHGPMIFVHSRLVKPPLTHSLSPLEAGS